MGTGQQYLTGESYMDTTRVLSSYIGYVMGYVHGTFLLLHAVRGTTSAFISYLMYFSATEFRYILMALHKCSYYYYYYYQFRIRDDSAVRYVKDAGVIAVTKN